MSLLQACVEKSCILVIGDLMLDRYLEGTSSRISPEAPVPIVNIEKDYAVLGGAANVAHNITALSGQAFLLGFSGSDASADLLNQKLKEAKIHNQIIRSSLPTIVKLRILSQHQQLLRLDFEKSYQDLDQDPLFEKFKTCLIEHPEIQTLIFSDYGKGTLKDISRFIEFASNRKLKTLVDPKGHDFCKYRGATLITPNYSEFTAVVGPCKDEAEMIKKGTQFLKDSRIQHLLITRGAEGMTLIEEDGSVTHQKTHAKAVFDVTGAGDTVIAVLGLALAADQTLKTAMHLSNAAAGVVVGKVGTSTLSFNELHEAIHPSETIKPEFRTGVLSRADLKAAVDQARVGGESIVFTNGCFDLLHLGHVEYLKKAKSLGDRLIVAVNSDASVRKLKGEHRPILPEFERLALLAALSCVDWVVSFEEDTPEPLLNLLKPDVLVKGGDYTETQIVGHEIVKSYGGKVLPLSFIPGRSSTQIIEKIRGK